MNSIILVAESGSDITKELAAQYGIRIVPMHVTFDNETLDDGSFPAEQIPEYYHQTGKLACRRSREQCSLFGKPYFKSASVYRDSGW